MFKTPFLKKVAGSLLVLTLAGGVFATSIYAVNAAAANPQGCEAWKNGQMNGADNGYGKKIGQDPDTHAQNRQNGC